MGKRQIGLVERSDRSDIFPIIIKDIALQLVATLEGLRNDFLAEILITRIGIEQVEQGVSAEDVNPHRRQVRTLLGRIRTETKSAGVDRHLKQRITLGLFAELLDVSIIIRAHQAERLGLFRVHRKGCNGEVSTSAAVMFNEQAVIHPVQLVTGQDQVFIDIPFLEQPLVLPYSVGSAFKPGWTVRRLLGSQHLNESLTEGCAQVERLAEVTIERRTVELRHHVHLVDVRVDAVADGDINQSILTGQGDGRLGAHLGERVETSPGTAAENDGQNPLHAVTPDRRCRKNLPEFHLVRTSPPADPTRLVRIKTGLGAETQSSPSENRRSTVRRAC